MNPIEREVAKQAKRHGVTTEAVLGRDRTRAATMARRAVWAVLLTRYPGGAYPAAVLARAFGRQPKSIRVGAAIHERSNP